MGFASPVELPVWLPALTSLTSFWFEAGSLPTGCDNAGRLAGLAQLRKLTVRVIYETDNPLPDGLHGLPRLTELDLRVPGAPGVPGNPTASSLSRLSALHTLRWSPTGPWTAALPAGILELRSLRSLELARVTPESLHPGLCWAGLTHLFCNFRPRAPTLTPVLALATALERLALNGLKGLDDAAPAMLARLPALRHLGLDFAEMEPYPDKLYALGQACPHVSLYDSVTSDDDDGWSDDSEDDDGWME